MPSKVLKKIEEDPQYPFNFPFRPYDIQAELMKVAYDSFEENKLAILESPTGTGKSLSLICSSLSWLKDHQSKLKSCYESEKQKLSEKIEELKGEEDAGDWLSAQTKRQNEQRKLDEINHRLEKILSFEAKDEARWHAKLHNKPFSEYPALSKTGTGNSITHVPDGNTIGSQESDATVDKEANDDIEQRLKYQQQQQQEHLVPKIYYASRTHSQLSQFISEIKKTKFADRLSKPPVKVTPLASRSILCTNSEVMRLKNSNAINERCIELQKDKKCSYLKNKEGLIQLKEEILSDVQDIEVIVSQGKSIGACPYYASRLSIPEAEVIVLPYNNLLHQETRQASSLNLKDSVVIVDEAHNILETICSIHSSQITGQQLISSHSLLSQYYSKYHNRMSPKNAETIKIIVQCLTAMIRFLNEATKFIKIDEDVDTTTAMPSLNAESHGKFEQLEEEIIVDVKKFIIASKIERFNIFKIIDYFNRSQLARKLIGFFQQDNNLDLSLDLSQVNDSKIQNDGDSGQTTKPVKIQSNKKRKILSASPEKRNSLVSSSDNVQMKPWEQTNLLFLKKLNPEIKEKPAASSGDHSQQSSYPIYTLIEFFKSLTNLVDDGKICIRFHRGNIEQSFLKFILLNPSSQFDEMTKEARSIVLAGGTMKPFEEFTDLLFGPLGIDEKRLQLFSCEHVIDKKQLYVSTLNTGATGKPLELSYKTRKSYDYLDEFGRTIANLSNVTPGGMVCFFPSYEYEQICFRRWTQINVINAIESKSKRVFREPKQTNQVKLILDEYSRVIDKGASGGRGALLMCVVGGKMSEGINFNDDLGRCIVMVGLPYANIKSGELQQKMAYYNKTVSSKHTAGAAAATVSAGQQYYENLCIKGINQSIGRAIRHRNDYASIILLDRRYSTKLSIRQGLPDWIKKSLVDHERFGPMLAQVKQFFNNQQVSE